MKQFASLLLLLVGLTGLLPGADPVLPRKANELAFTVPGQGEKLLSQYRGKVIALEFILTTCPHCQAASKMMTNLQREFGPRGLQCIDVAINALDEGNSKAQADQMVQNFSQQFQVGFPVGYSARDQMYSFTGFSVMDRFVVPQLILIDRKGTVRYQTPPLGDEHAMEEPVIRQRLQELLNDKATSSASKAPARKSLR